MAIEIETDKRKATGKYGKIFGTLGAVLIIVLIIMSGPAQAFVLNLSSDKISVSNGESVIFTASVDINSNENLPILKLVLELNGPENALCEFNVNGTILNISACKGISIQKMIVENSKQGYGYGEYNGYGYDFGYGYGYIGNLEYKITLFTTNYLPGAYSTLLKAYIGSEVFSKNGNNLTINSSSGSGDSGYYGFSSGRTICLNNGWKCSEWSGCIDGKQTRICSSQPNCYLGTRPEEQRICVVAPNINPSLSNYENLAGTLDQNGNSEDQNLNSNNGNSNSDNGGNTNMDTFGIIQSFLAGITGAVIGTPGENPLILWIAVIFLAVMAGIVIGLFLVRGIRRARKIRKIKELNRIRYRPPRQ